MVYKIMGNFNSDNFESILNKIKQYFKFMYKNEALYIALIDYSKKEDASVCMKKAFRPVRDFYIKEISEKNIMDEETVIIEWCRDNLVLLDRQRYEIREQEKLKQTMCALDNLERILAEKKRDMEVSKEEEVKKDKNSL